MLHHIIVKWNENVTDKAEWNRRAAEAFSDATSIEGVTGCALIPSCSDRSNRYDLMIRMEMTPEGLLNWDTSEQHKAWKANFGGYIAQKCIFDCDSPFMN